MSGETTLTVEVPQPDQSGMESASKPSNLLREIVETALLTAIIFLIVNAAIGRFRIESVSMEPNLHEGEYVIVDKISYQLRPPERGDIIVFTRANQPDLIKRVIGLPGDTVEVHRGQVFVNGAAISEPYIASPANYEMAATLISADQYFVLGDNRSNSSDSHVWGTVSKSTIVGRAWIIYWPPPNWQIVPHYTYAAAATAK